VEAEDRVAPVHLPFSPAQGLGGTVAPVLAVVAETVRGWDPTPPFWPPVSSVMLFDLPAKPTKGAGIFNESHQTLAGQSEIKDKRKLEVAGKSSQTLSLLPKSA